MTMESLLPRRRVSMSVPHLIIGILVCSSLSAAFVVKPQSTASDTSSRVGAPTVRPNPFWTLPDTKPPRAMEDSGTVTTFLPFTANERDMPFSVDAKAEPSFSSDSESLSPPPRFELNIWTARVLLLLVAAIWGTNFSCVKYLEGLCFHPPCNHPPSEFAFARFGIAALVSWPLLVNQPFRVIAAGMECGLTITIGYITQAMALTSIASGKCAFICSLTVVFVPLVASIMYGKPIKGSTIVAAAVALSGVGVLEGLIDIKEVLGLSQAVAATGDIVDAGSATASVSSSIETAATALAGPIESIAKTLGVSKGDLIALGQPLGFGYTFLRIEHYQEQFKDVPNRVLTIAAAQCVSVGILSFLWVLYDYHWTLPNFGYLMEPHRVATLLWTGIVTTVAAIFLEGIALQKASATDASIAFSSEPVWASLFGFLLLHEQLGFDAYAGGAIIMLACIIGAAADLKEQEDNKLKVMEP